MSKLLIISLGIILFLPVKLQAASYQMADLTELDSTKCLYSFGINIDTEGKSSNAADLIIKYDSNEVTIVDADPITTGTQVITGSAYESYIYNNSQDSKGEIKLTAVRFDYLNGKQLFVQVPFVAKNANPTFKIVFDGAGDTYDSNIAELTTSKDLLTSVENMPLNITHYECGLTPAQISSISVSESQTQSTTPSSSVTIIATSFSTLLIVGFLCLILLVIFRKRIKIVEKQGNKVISGVLLNLYADGKYFKSYVSNKRGYIWISRKDLKKSAEFSKDGFKDTVLNQGIGRDKIIELPKA